ncbi:hypothetical protein ACX80E_00600 [Arthrobacter sp. TMN-49]
MAKKSKSTKKSRFGNPAKAAADAAERANLMSLADVRLDRAMEALSPGFALWLEGQTDGDKDIDFSLMVLDDFFDMYRILEPQTDALSLVPDAVREVMEVSADANPQSTFALRSGVRDYVNYLVQASLWTGTPGDLVELAEVFKQPAWPGLDPATELNLAALLPAANIGPDLPDPADYDFPAVVVPALTAEQFIAAAASSPLWQNTVALLAWVGEGRDTTTKGILRKKDRAEAAAALRHSGAGILAEAAKAAATTAELTAESMDRLKLYWHLLASAGLIQFETGKVFVSASATDALAHESSMAETFVDMLGTFIFVSTLTGSQEGAYEPWHLDMASFMVRCGSATPPASAALATALQAPDTADPQLLIRAKNVASWAAEGLVTVGEDIVVPAAFRLDLVDMLKDDFGVAAVGPGAGLDLAALLGAG